MPTQTLYCGIGANFNDGGNTAWGTPTNIEGDTTGTAASVTPATNGHTSQVLRASNFGFTIPSDATVNGIVVEQERVGSANNRFYDANVRLLVAGVESGDNKSTGLTYRNTKGFQEFGGASDLWAASPTPAIVNATGFGVSFKGVRSSGAGVTANVFRVRIIVHYTEFMPPEGGSESIVEIDGVGLGSKNTTGFSTSEIEVDGVGLGVKRASGFSEAFVFVFVSKKLQRMRVGKGVQNLMIGIGESKLEIKQWL